jgi:hypothetical protein
MSCIVKEPNGEIRDLIKSPRGFGYCNNCKAWRNYGCTKGQNPMLCNAKEPEIREQSDTCCTYPKLGTPQISSVLPKTLPHTPLKKFVQYLDNLAESDVKAYNTLTGSDQFNRLISDFQYQAKENGWANYVK